MSLFDLDFLGFEKRAEKEQEGGGAGSSGWMALPKKTRGYLSILANLFVKYIDEKEEKAFDSDKSDEKILFSTKLKQLYEAGKKGQAKKLVSQLRKKHKVMSKKKVTVKDEDGNEKEVEKSVWNPDSQYFQWFKTNAAKHVEGKAKKRSVKELVEQVKGQKKENSKPKAEKPKEKKETEGKKEEKSQGNLPKDWKTWPKARRQKWIQDQKNKEEGTPTSQKNTQSTSTRGAPKNLPNTGRKLASTSNLLAYAQHSPNPVKFLVKLASKLPKKEALKALKQASKIASTARLLKTLKDEFSHINKVDPRDPAYVRVKELLRKLDDQTLEMVINEDIKFVSRLAMTILTMRKN